MIKIDRLGHSGDGIAAGPIYVPRTLPGEEVGGEIVSDRIDAPKILVPSPDRIKPQCPAYQRCGGCALHHAKPEFVSHWKASVVTQALASHGINMDVRHLHASPANSRRRAKLSGRRTKKGATVGFFAPRSDVLHDITGCLTLTQGILALIPKLEQFTTAFGSRKGTLQFWILETETGMDVAVDGLIEVERKFPDLVQWAHTAKVARLSAYDDVIVTLTEPR
ncbi:MAG: class I SAM-dependent RNA methyltransferase, partial [Pseudomonadota bacterium]